MKPTIRLTRSAVDDMRAIQDWYREQDVPDIGKRFNKDILDRVERLRDHPEKGRMVPEFQQPTLRELIIPPFRIVYRCQKRTIDVIRIWRSERLLKLPDAPE